MSCLGLMLIPFLDSSVSDNNKALFIFARWFDFAHHERPDAPLGFGSLR